MSLGNKGLIEAAVIILISAAASIHAFSRLFDGWPFLAVHAWSIGILLFFCRAGEAVHSVVD